MEILITEIKNQLSYKINGSDLPVNSAIREYRHPENLDNNAWDDFRSISNGDQLNVTYVGSKAGFDTVQKRAPQKEADFSIVYVDYLQEKLTDYSQQFNVWLQLFNQSETGKKTWNLSEINEKFQLITHSYTGIELMEQLNDYGKLLTSWRFIGGIDQPLKQVIEHQEQQAEELLRQRQLTNQQIKYQQTLATKPADNLSNRNFSAETLTDSVRDIQIKCRNLKKALVTTGTFNNDDQIDQAVDTEWKEKNTNERATAIRQAVIDISEITGSFVRTVDDTLDAASVEQKMNVILTNTSVGESKVTVVQQKELPDGNQSWTQAIITTEKLGIQLMNSVANGSDKIADRLAGAALIQLVNLGRVLQIQPESQKLNADIEAMAVVQRDSSQKEVSKLIETITHIDSQIAQSRLEEKQAKLATDLKHQMPPMPEF